MRLMQFFSVGFWRGRLCKQTFTVKRSADTKGTRAFVVLQKLFCQRVDVISMLYKKVICTLGRLSVGVLLLL